MTGIILFIIVLSFLVIIHELGHYFAAKWSGIKVHEFGLGYPPTAWKIFSWGGTDFTLNWIPFGGFVRLAGEEVFQDQEADKKTPISKSEKIVAKEKEMASQIEDSSLGKFYNAPVSKKLVIILAGVTANFLFGIIAFAIVFSQMGIPELLTEPRIGEVADDSPVALAGVPTDVNILALESESSGLQAVADAAAVVEFVERYAGQTVTLYTTGVCDGFVCEDREQQFSVYIRTAEEIPAGQGALGIAFQPVVFVQYPAWEMPFRGAWYGLKQAFFLGLLILQMLGVIFSQLLSQGVVPEDIAGPVGIVHQAQTSGILAEGWKAVLSFSGMLSINLAIMNLLPILPLDGGRAVLIAIGPWIRKSYMQKIEYYGNYSGFLALISLLLLVTFRDIARLFTG